MAGTRLLLRRQLTQLQPQPPAFLSTQNQQPEHGSKFRHKHRLEIAEQSVRGVRSKGWQWTASSGAVDHAQDLLRAEVVQPVGSGVDEVLYESPVPQRLVVVDLGAAPAPDETTVMRFRHLP